MPKLPPLPRWFWLLPVLALGCWWPVDAYWQSDDYLALHYAQELRRALADFAGPQYGSTDIWLFYRPLITLSFWVDQQIAGAAPWFAHLSNAIAHAGSACLLGLLARRWLATPQAFLAALWWACLPSHAGSIAWAVGRVDSHTTVWCLAAVWCAARAAERHASGQPARRAGMIVATLLALLSKELAFVVPALASLVAMTRSPGTLRQRFLTAVHCTWPLWVLLAVALALRWPLLGRFGGYLGTQYDAGRMAEGLLVVLTNLAAPLRWTAPELALWPAVPVAAWVWFGSLAAALAAAASLRCGRRTLWALGAFVVACAPMAGFLGDPGNAHNLRYFYLPSTALAVALAHGGIRPMGLLLAATLPALAMMRVVQTNADRTSASMHHALLAASAEAPRPEAPLFVAGLPHANARGTVVQLHFGVDRMLEPPFGAGGLALYAHRPLAALPGVVTLSAPDAAPVPLPGGSTWWFRTPTDLLRVPGRAPELPELPLDLGPETSPGEVDLSTARLFEWTGRAAKLFATHAPSAGLRTPGVQPMGYRVTIFTANGYLACLCRDYGLAGPTDGWIDWLRFLAQDPQLGIPPAVVATVGTAWAGEALRVPTAIDRDPVFPTLVEAGRFAPSTGQFVPSHRARRLLALRFDRGYSGWVRKVQGK
jgi:hypothetical protein